MPTEKITDGVSRGWYTEVSWRRAPDGDDRGSAEGHVQLATVNSFSPFEFPEREQDGAWVAGERFDGWRVTLDEAGIDRLIKALHKAKRQAYGESTTAKPPTLPVPARAALRHVGYSTAQLDDFDDLAATGGDVVLHRDHLGSLSVTVGGRRVKPEGNVTVESDATAAARLDTDRYRATRRGDR